ncbi:MAG: DegT/DnrJ/EryC1/StrS family aminotransferase [Elusimicrobiota bacterium]|nr:DegT/DnrJ/EryC1/StrS family aminotransferase [Elusimicrobiota bacterium]
MIRHSMPSVYDVKSILRDINKIFKYRYFAENKFVAQFEKALCKFFGSKYAVCVSSGTAALHLALNSLGVDTHSEVIIPAYTCAAILNSVLYTGAKPVIVDVDIEDGNINYMNIKKAITKKTAAIIVPHMFGFPVKDIKIIVELGIPVIEDTTQSLGARVNNKLVGTFGKINVLSFYATKLITTFGEGGAILTDDEKIYKIIKDIKEYDKKTEFKIRYNYKLAEIQAIMGIYQMKNVYRVINKRRKIFEYYKNELKNCNKIKILSPKENTEPVFYRFILQLKNENLKYCIQKFKSFGIEVARPVYLPLDKYYLGKFVCKNAKMLYDTTLSLPIYPDLRKSDLNYIVDVTKKII